MGKARELGICGWVRNLQDGRVEVFAQGDEPAIDRLMEQLHRGSPASRVDSVNADIAQVDDIKGFTRRQSV
jgi:acylphosphatase